MRLASALAVIWSPDPQRVADVRVRVSDMSLTSGSSSGIGRRRHRRAAATRVELVSLRTAAVPLHGAAAWPLALCTPVAAEAVDGAPGWAPGLTRRGAHSPRRTHSAA